MPSLMNWRVTVNLNLSSQPPPSQSRMGVAPINSFQEFQNIVNSGRPILIDFWATWCGPCRMISPVFERLSHELSSTGLLFFKVDVDEQPDISQAVGIRAMPTFILFQNGAKVKDLVGADQGRLQALVAEAQSLV